MNKNELIAYYLRRIYNNNLTTCFGGNISLREKQFFLISETGIDKSIITEKHISCVSYDNVVINDVIPSSEYKLHSMIYNHHSEINAIIHAHPPYATAYALSNARLDSRISSEMYKNLGEIITSRYEHPGSPELAIAVNEAAFHGRTILMKNHGIIVLAEDIQKAYYMIELVEQLAKMTYIISAIGQQTPIESENLINLGGK